MKNFCVFGLQKNNFMKMENDVVTLSWTIYDWLEINGKIYLNGEFKFSG